MLKKHRARAKVILKIFFWKILKEKLEWQVFFLIFKVAIFCMVKRPIIIEDLCSGLWMDIKFWKSSSSIQLHSQCLGLHVSKNSSDPTVAWLYLLYFINWAWLCQSKYTKYFKVYILDLCPAFIVFALLDPATQNSVYHICGLCLNERCSPVQYVLLYFSDIFTWIFII